MHKARESEIRAELEQGRIFDDRDNRMTPSHCNKAGVRYRYYVSSSTSLGSGLRQCL
jgi:hypothetical protein